MCTPYLYSCISRARWLAYGQICLRLVAQIETNIRSLRILIADDHPIIRKHVRRILEEQPTFSVCGEAYDGVEAIEEAQRLKPDVVVLNVSTPILNGLDAGRKIKSELPETAIVILSSNAD